MHIIHCTQKLLKELAVPLVNPAVYPESTEGLGNWYANLFRIERRKCVLFTNEKTFYSFVVLKVLKKDLNNIKEVFLNHLVSNFRFEEFPPEMVNREEYRDIGFAKTASRSILGSMNELRFQFEYDIYREGGIDNINQLEANHQLNRNIMGALKYGCPVDAMRDFLQK
jgi:hypothetical protein